VPLGSTPNSFAGIAVTGNAATVEGTWQWFDGVAWNDIDTAVSDSKALVLAGTTAIRFLAAPAFSGAAPDLTAPLIADSPPITNKCGDDLTATGRGGPPQNSAGTVARSATETPVNDAPVLSAGPDMPAENEDGGPPVGAVGTLVGTIADLGGGGGADNIS